MMIQQALILFAHGARDPAWAEPFRRLQSISQLSLPDVTVELAFLELMKPSLPEQVEKLVATGIRQITIVPVFLGQGGHVRRDLPLLIEQLRQSYPSVAFKIAAAAGEDAGVLQALAQYCVTTAQDD